MINTSIKGLTVEFKKSGNFLYGYLRHDESGLLIRQWNNKPLTTGKKAFCNKIDIALKEFDWTLSYDGMDRKEERRKAIMSIEY